MAPTSKQVLQLYKSILSKASKFDNYNFREYFRRKAQHDFKEHKNVADEQQITRLYNEGIDQLALLNRQSAISQMFTFEKLVVEPLKKHH
ncbi:hypothetical protein PUMCH_002384 [Australozyma saopauloensis]|uniref:Complex 1 LYR protein domain-containing protein n=1 Tax=Australozyma saopauloensis TaxID=291208 RepID=A0AAX4H9A5_9ASCO|nr:hypothetical protein PUMCH_002384 [[Candida] saopauloensis]